MNNPTKTILIVLVLAVLTFGVYKFLNKPSTAPMDSQEQPAMMKKDDSAMEDTKTVDNKMMDSRYIQYSTDNFEKYSNNRRVLFFYASWCPTCKPADTSFTQNLDKIPADVTLIRVNYNDPETDQNERDLAKKYNVTYQHTFIQIDSSGNEVTKWNGGKIDELLSNIK